MFTTHGANLSYVPVSFGFDGRPNTVGHLRLGNSRTERDLLSRITSIFSVTSVRSCSMFLRFRGISSFTIVFFAVASSSAFAAAPCALSQVSPSVTVCTPSPNALVQSQVNVVAGSTDSKPVTAMQVYLDNKLVYQVK